MNSNDWKTARVVGFFSLPSASLAEHNPAAYNNAMAAAPAGAGTCAHCGTGIIHHVVINYAGGSAFIGTTCAEKIGGEIATCVRNRQTAEQKSLADAARDARHAKWQAEQAEIDARKSKRGEDFADVLAALNTQGTSFHRSLAEQLVLSALSERQAECAAKAIFGRRVKRNAAEFDATVERLVAE
jgi:hypothetical protein